MSRLRVAAAVAVTVVTPVLLTVGATPAAAGTPTGTCTKSYTPSTVHDLAFDPAAVAIFDVIDTNHDHIICFKYYPNGPHAGHAGNLVDDKAAPHT
jgi:hypothetical protein